MLGVNLIHAAFFRREDPAELIAVADGRPVARARRDRHDQALGPGLPGRGQPADEPAARRAGADRRGHVHGGAARSCSRRRCSTRSRSWSSAAASGRRRSSRSTCSTGRWSSSSRSRASAGRQPVVLAEMTLRSLNPEPRRRTRGLPRPGGHPAGSGLRRAHLAVRAVSTSWPSTSPATPTGRSGSRSGCPPSGSSPTRSTTPTCRAACSSRSGGCSSGP